MGTILRSVFSAFVSTLHAMLHLQLLCLHGYLFTSEFPGGRSFFDGCDIPTNRLASSGNSETRLK